MTDFEEVKLRHAKETEELEKKIAEMLAGAKTKNERKRLNQQAEKMRRDLFEKQQQEADDPLFDIAASISQEYQHEKAKEVPKVAPDTNENKKKANKINKARQKRLRKAQERYEFENKLVNAVKESNVRGQTELQKANEQLLKLGLKMRPVIGDGNCLYRSVAYCLSQIGLKEYEDQNKGLKALREKTANELRKNKDKYFDFSNCANDEEYEKHCDRVENTSEWGGELEVTALSNALNISFIIHRVGFEPMKHGEQLTSIQLFFLEYFTSSGAHYNSVVPIDK